MEKGEAERNAPVPMVAHSSTPVGANSKGSTSSSGSSNVQSGKGGDTDGKNHLSEKPSNGLKVKKDGSNRGKSHSASSGSGSSSSSGSEKELGKKGTLVCDGKAVDSEVYGPATVWK